MAVTRLNMNIDSDLIARLDSYAEQLHINRSAAMSVVLSTFFQQQDTMKMLGKLTDIYDKEKPEQAPEQ